MKNLSSPGARALTPFLPILALCSSTLLAQEFREARDIPYSDASRVCALDIRWPVGVTNFATVVNLHGGGLVGGTRHYARLPQYAGQSPDPVASVAVTYRLMKAGDDAVRPEHCLDDAAASVAWVFRHIAEYGGSPRKVFLTGISAGGYQTAMVAMDPKWLGKYGFKPTDLCGAAPITGQVTKHFNVRAIGFRDADPRYAPKIDAWAPLYWCREGDLPPIALMTGGRRDNEMPCRVEENEFLAVSLRETGHRNVAFYETEGSHGGCVEPSFAILRDFIARYADTGMAGRPADGERIGFIGDSITHGGLYVADLQLFQALRHPGERARLINLGISGDSLGGGLRRLEADILPAACDRVFVMMGMNDVGRDNWGSAEPSEKERASRSRAVTAYARNLRTLVDRLAARRLKTVLVTPSPYDQYSTRVKAKNYAYCNDGLAQCAEAVRALAAERNLGLVDLHAPLTAILKAHPEKVFCGDRVHPGAEGHLIMAALILNALHEQPCVAQVALDAKTGAVRARGAARHGKSETQNACVSAVLPLAGRGVAFTYAPKALPLPEALVRSVQAYYPITQRLNAERLFITGLDAGTYALAFDGVRAGTFTAAEFERGVDIAPLDTPNQRRSREAAACAEKLAALVRERRNEQLILNRLGDNGIDPADAAKADQFLNAWLEKLKDSPHARTYRSWVDTYRRVHARHGVFAADEEDLRERLYAVRPAVSRVTVVRCP